MTFSCTKLTQFLLSCIIWHTQVNWKHAKCELADMTAQTPYMSFGFFP